MNILNLDSFYSYINSFPGLTKAQSNLQILIIVLCSHIVTLLQTTCTLDNLKYPMSNQALNKHVTGK